MVILRVYPRVSYLNGPDHRYLSLTKNGMLLIQDLHVYVFNVFTRYLRCWDTTFMIIE